MHKAVKGDCRIVEFDSKSENHLRHLARYDFASKFCNDKRVADIATGVGYGADHIAQNSSAKSIICGDISENAVHYLNANFNPKLLAAVMDATVIPLADKSIDVFTSFETVEHIPTFKDYLSEIQRIVADDGLALISTPARRYRSPYSKKPRNRFHFIEWDFEDYKELLSNYFDDIEFYGQFVPKHPTILKICAPFFDDSLYKIPILSWVLPRLAGRTQRYFGASKYPENNTNDFLKKHEVRPISKADKAIVFVAICRKPKTRDKS